MSGTARRTKELAESFVKNNHFVTVLTSTPREYRSFPDYKFKSFEILNGVFVYRVNTLFEIKRNVLFRMLSYFSFFVQSLFIAIKLSNKADIIISIAPLSSGLIGAVCQKITKKHHHFDVPDILPDLGISSGMIKNKLVIYILYKLEKWVYKHSNSISAITHGQIENIHNKGVSRKKISYIPDWIDDAFFKTNLELYKLEVLKSLDYPDKKIISFVGNIGALQNPEIFLKTMVLLAKDKLNKFLFLFIGDGIMLPNLKEKTKKLNLKNVTFIGRVKREYIPAYMYYSDILVANYLPNEYLDICIPGKLFEYAISKRPIIMGARGEAKNLITKYNLGLAVTPSNVNEFTNAIIQISSGSYKFNPKTNKFTNDFSLKKIVRLYDYILQKVK